MEKFKLFTVMAVMASLAACSSDSGGGGSLSANGESGSKVALTGEWESSCTTPFSTDEKTVFSFSGTTISVYTDSYTSNDGSCTGTVTRGDDLDYINSSASAGNAGTDEGDKTVLGWRDTFSIDAVAPTSNAGPALTDLATATKIKMPTAWTDLGSGEYHFIIYIDDTDGENGNYTMYMAESENTAGTYPDYLITEAYTMKK